MTDKLEISDRIIHLENDFCVVTKLAGENSQTDIPKIFKEEIEFKLNKKIDFIECPHRLDMPVSGVQIIALNKESFNFFTQNFSNNKIYKTYWTIVEGVHDLQYQTLQDFLVFNTKKQKAYLHDEQVRKSKKVVLDFNIFAQGQKYSFVEVFPQTGRTHQIRAQLSKNLMAIKGDVKYGAKRSEKMGGIRLHAGKIALFHPVTKEYLEFFGDFPFEDNLWLEVKKSIKNIEELEK